MPAFLFAPVLVTTAIANWILSRVLGVGIDAFMCTATSHSVYEL